MPPQSLTSSIGPLATENPSSNSDVSPGDAAFSGGTGGGGDSDAGATGHTAGAMSLSGGVIAAIIVVVVVVVLLVIASAVLFYLAKKRNWQMREAMRRSARKVVRAMTPRRMTFGSDADGLRSPASRRTLLEKDRRSDKRTSDEQTSRSAKNSGTGSRSHGKSGRVDKALATPSRPGRDHDVEKANRAGQAAQHKTSPAEHIKEEDVAPRLEIVEIDPLPALASAPPVTTTITGAARGKTSSWWARRYGK